MDAIFFFVLILIIGAVVLIVKTRARPQGETKPVPLTEPAPKTVELNIGPATGSNHFFSKVAGVTKTNDDGTSRQDIIRELRAQGGNPRLNLVHEEDNQYDENAVKVCTQAGQQIGYLKRELAEEVIAKSRDGYEWAAFVSEVTGGEDGKPTLGVNLFLVEMEPSASEDLRRHLADDLSS